MVYKGYEVYIKAEVSESHFFNLKTRMRISPTQSRTSKRDQKFLILNLMLRDETDEKSSLISGIETRLRFIIFILRLRDENENSLHLISVFETRTRILKVAIFPWIQAWTASLFCMQFLGGCYTKCRTLHFAWFWSDPCSPSAYVVICVAINAIK